MAHTKEDFKTEVRDNIVWTFLVRSLKDFQIHTELQPRVHICWMLTLWWLTIN